MAVVSDNRDYCDFNMAKGESYTKRNRRAPVWFSCEGQNYIYIVKFKITETHLPSAAAVSHYPLIIQTARHVHL